MSSLPRARWRSSPLARIGIVAGAVALAFGFGQRGWADPPAAATGPSLWSTLGASSSLRAAYWNRDKSFSSDRNFGVGQAWLSLRPDEWQGLKFSGDGYLYEKSGSAAVLEGREAYIDATFGDLDVRVGRQVIVWGRADKVNPTDSWTTRDYRRLMTDDEDQRLGIFATQLAYSLGSTRVVGIWQPEWREPGFPISASPGINLSLGTPLRSALQGGVKIEQTGGALEGSMSYFNGINRTPDLKFISAGASGTELELSFNRIQVWGGDFAFNLGDFGIRGEVAYTDTDNAGASDPLRQTSSLYAVLGADRSLIENLNLNLQLLYRHTFDFRDPSTYSDANTQTLARQEGVISNQQYSDQYGLSLRPSYKAFHETLETELAYVIWFRSQSSLLRPKVTYAIDDHFKAILGGEWYSGEAASFFGRLRETSSVFSELRFAF